MILQFEKRLEDAINECIEYGDPVPSHNHISRAISSAREIFEENISVRIYPSIGGSGLINLTIFTSDSDRYSIIIGDLNV